MEFELLIRVTAYFPAWSHTLTFEDEEGCPGKLVKPVLSVLLCLQCRGPRGDEVMARDQNLGQISTRASLLLLLLNRERQQRLGIWMINWTAGAEVRVWTTYGSSPRALGRLGHGVWIPGAAEVCAPWKAELPSSPAVCRCRDTHSPSIAEQQLRKCRRSPSGYGKQSERMITAGLSHTHPRSAHLPTAASHRKMET